MSAFIVGEAHIDYLVAAAIRFCRVPLEDASKLGRLLWEENCKSVNYRYSSAEECPAYEFTPAKLLRVRPEPVQALKAVSCLEYQACERPDWQDSEARRALDDIKDGAISWLPGYEQATWEVR